MSFLGNIWNSIKGFVRLIATGDDGIDNEDIIEKGLQSVGYDGVVPNGANDVSSDLTNITTDIGKLWNNLSGTTAQNEFIAEREDLKHQREVDLANTEIQRRVQDIKDAGLSPTLFYASGGNGASTPSSAGASTGSGSAMDVFGSIGSIMNSINTARELDWRTGRDQMPNRTTSEMYDSLGNLIHTIVNTSTK